MFRGEAEIATIRIFLADDHLVVREGLKTLINAQPDMIVIGEADDGQIAWQQARDCRPGVVIMDITMPHMNGVQATEQLKRWSRATAMRTGRLSRIMPAPSWEDCNPGTWEEFKNTIWYAWDTARGRQ
jgi:CheY-like chemotaxis protein